MSTKLLCDAISDQLQSRKEIVSPIFLSKIFSDKDTGNHGELWDSLLLYLKRTYRDLKNRNFFSQCI